MPYSTIEKLPPNLQRVLPKHAQEIYLAAFNNAWNEYVDRGGKRDSLAHRVAWSVVKKSYEKTPSGEWIKKAPD